MSGVTLCNRVSGKTSRTKITEVDFKAKVDVFRERVAGLINYHVKEIELIYCGKKLMGDDILESFGMKAGCTVHVLRRQCPFVAPPPEKMSNDEIKQVVTALQTAFLNPAFRSTVENMLSNPETLENIIAATPGLDSDPTAMRILQDPELLAILADPTYVHKVIEAHPTLGQAAIFVAAAVNEHGAMSTATTRSRSARGTYSLDHMSDDEEVENPPRQGGGEQTITASQLAAALAATSGALSAAAAQPDAPPPQSFASLPGSSGVAISNISEDFFRQAIQQAQSATIESQVQQMRDMGITDENVARRALEATGGNLHAAIELIFGDGI